MIKQLMDHLNYGFFAELALVLFAIIFVAIVVRTLMTGRDVLDRQAEIVLDEKTEIKL